MPLHSSLVLRLGLGLVLFGWSYDLHFNPTYYTHVLGALAPTMQVLLPALGASILIGFATTFTAPLAAVLFAYFGLALEGHQPIGLPQNAGLAAGALALALIGPGPLAPGRTTQAATPRQVQLAALVLRLGLALVFLVYGTQKFINQDEYRIVVAEVSVLKPVTHLVGAQIALMVIGTAEVLMGLSLLVRPLVLWGSLGQIFMLVSFLAALGYPMSYPQDTGLVATLLSLAFLQPMAWPLLARRSAVRPVIRTAHTTLPVPVEG
jgi:uncharacterized membrane protein YphA (DoxX/SURF4 family)